MAVGVVTCELVLFNKIKRHAHVRTYDAHSLHRHGGRLGRLLRRADELGRLRGVGARREGKAGKEARVVNVLAHGRHNVRHVHARVRREVGILLLFLLLSESELLLESSFFLRFFFLLPFFCFLLCEVEEPIDN